MTRGRWLLVLLLLLAVGFALTAAALWPRPEAVAPAASLPMPERGETIAAFAEDDHPLWVIRHEDGPISVLDAFSTHVPFGVNKLTWWCPRSRVFDDPFHGSRYNEFGDPTSGPAPTGLAGYPFSVAAGRILIGGASEERPMASDDTRFAPDSESFCTREEALFHDYSSLPLATSPTMAAASGDGRWQRLHASLIPIPERSSSALCWAANPVADDDCAEVELPGMEHYTRGLDDQFGADTWADVDWLVRAVDGRIVELAFPITGD